MLVIKETIRVFSLSVARNPMVKIAKTLRNCLLISRGQSEDFVKNALFPNIKIYTRTFVELIHDLRVFRLSPRCS